MEVYKNKQDTWSKTEGKHLTVSEHRIAFPWFSLTIIKAWEQCYTSNQLNFMQ